MVAIAILRGLHHWLDQRLLVTSVVMQALQQRLLVVLLIRLFTSLVLTPQALLMLLPHQIPTLSGMDQHLVGILSLLAVVVQQPMQLLSTIVVVVTHQELPLMVL